MDLVYEVDDSLRATWGDTFLQILSKCFFMPQRYVLTLMGFLGLVCGYAMNLVLSVAITQMVPPPLIIANLTTSVDEPICPYIDYNYNEDHFDYEAILDMLYNSGNKVFDWSQEQQGVILSSFYWGYVITQIPGALLSQRFGGKPVFFWSILLSALCTIVTPTIVQTTEMYGLITLRIIIGLGQGLMYAALTDLLAVWIPLEERTMLASFAYGGSTVGTIGGTYLASLFIHEYKSWHQVFYYFGFGSIVWCLAFSVMCYNRPDCHPFIKYEEKKYLREQMGQASHEKKRLQYQNRYQRSQRIPWRQILTSGPFIASTLCQISHEWAFCVIVLDLPKYMNDVLHFSIQDNGIYSSIPQLIKLIMAVVTGSLHDWLIAKKHLTITGSRRIFVSIASGFTGVFIVLASYAECDSYYVVLHFAISVAFQGVPGIAINALDLSPNFAGILMGVSSTISSITGILVPYIVGIATPNSLLSEWRIVFWITLVLQMAKMFIFSIWGSGNVQPWNSYDDETEQNQFYNDSDVSECEYADDGSLDDCEFNRRYSI